MKPETNSGAGPGSPFFPVITRQERVLLRALLRSTGSRNLLKYSRDKKKRGFVIGNRVAYGILFLLLMFYVVSLCMGYAAFGLIGQAPLICALCICVIAFFLTLLKTNGYLFGFREYDWLMALPLEARSVAKCKFLVMYLKGLPWYLVISLAVLIVYGIHSRLPLWGYPLWLLLTLFLPILPMLAAALLGYGIAWLSIGFRNKNLVQAILLMALALLLMLAGPLLGSAFPGDDIEALLAGVAAAMQQAAKVYPPLQWFSDAAAQGSLLSALLLLAVSTAAFVLAFLLVGRSYARINSALKTRESSRRHKRNGGEVSAEPGAVSAGPGFRSGAGTSGGIFRGGSGTRSVENAIAFKEFKRLTGSGTYLVNAGFGAVLAVLAGLAALFVRLDTLLSAALEDAPLTVESLYPAVPLLVYCLTGMVATTACSPSLEGRNYWIVQSLPIPKQQLYRGKLRFNLYLMLPPTEFAILCVCLSARMDALLTVLCLLAGAALIFFSSCWGLVCGIRFLRLDWENEVEVVKQGAALAMYMFPNMLGSLLVIALLVLPGSSLSPALLLSLLLLAVLALGALCFGRAMRLAEKKG